MADMFVPLGLSEINEGEFLSDLEKSLANLQEQLLKHHKDHGHKAKSAKAVLKVEIALVCIDPDLEDFGCLASIKQQLPASPPMVSRLIAGKSQTGEQRLLCRMSGSTDDSPVQRVFATNDGRSVDTETGEVISEDHQDETD